jgi:peptidoglycan/xylan/chitin deacetylase (PgdA/CDA1 family)
MVSTWIVSFRVLIFHVSDIGSYVVTFPTAAQRALSSGHILCSHTWSHKQMTSLTNEQLVAEFYWSLRAIKEATGVTPKCWRPVSLKKERDNNRLVCIWR